MGSFTTDARPPPASSNALSTASVNPEMSELPPARTILLRTACRSILSPICETMVDLLARVEPEYQAKVRNNIVLAGGSSLISGLTDAVDKALLEAGGGRASVVKDPIFAGSDGGLAIARDASNADWEKLSV